MKVRMFAVYDTKALTYGPPFLAATDGLAVRMLGELVNDSNTIVGRHPADFRLFCLGVFDDASGLVTSVTPAEHVVDAIALVQHQPKLPIEEAAQ